MADKICYDLTNREQIKNSIENLDSKDIVNILSYRFSIERIAKHFMVKDYIFKGAKIDLTVDDSILMEFPTLKNDFPDYYDSASYKLLLILGLRHEKDFNDDLTIDLQNVIRKDNIDKILVWTCEEVPASKLQILKTEKTDLYTTT